MLFSGCATTSGKQAAVNAAIAALVEPGATNFKVEGVRRIGGHWRVEIWSLPKVPGGFTEVDVSDRGEVLKVYPGF
jgi:hypothetical protein